MPCILIHCLLSVIFELIKGEMAYVRDLENIETVCKHFPFRPIVLSHFLRCMFDRYATQTHQ
jgi:hypothetical protein